ncbi:MAG: hypothetical protein IKR52_00995 [Paludibacteraceae bacterium]|nr:hypothetical protein [Paludibacteraceae bacterium]
MNKRILLILPLFGLIFISCQKETKIDPDLHSWGEKVFYKDFLFKHYNPTDSMNMFHKTLRFEFSQNAKDSLPAESVLKLQLVEPLFDDKGLPTDLYDETKKFVLYKNGKECKNNTLQITTKDNRVNISIAFALGSKPEDFEDREYRLKLRVLDNGGLDRIGNTSVDSVKDVLLADEWVLRKDKIYNPLALGLFWVIVSIISFLIIWYLLVHLVIHPSVSFSRVMVMYPDGEERKIKTNGAYQLVCTNQKKTCSFFEKFFWGKIVYERNDFWTKDLIMTTGLRRNKIRLRGASVYTVPDELLRKEPIEITNEENKKVNIETN